MPHHVYLIPGFFGFANFGQLKYFSHVRDELQAAFDRAGESAEIHYVETLPTASLRRRAVRLLDTISKTAGDDRDPIHFIGHSTGGLDARLVVSPGVTLPSRFDVEQIAQRVRSVICVASPNHGAPLAALFTSVLGQHLLRLLSIATLHSIRLGSIPLPALVALAGLMPRLGRMEGPLLKIADQAYRLILKDFDKDRREDLEEFLSAAADEQALMPQLTPESMDVFNAATTWRFGTNYGCVVTQTRAPALKGHRAAGFSPSAQAMYALFRGMHAVAGELPERNSPTLTKSQTDALMAAYDALPDTGANDAIVPTLSQVWGEVIHADWADHLDVIGHFSDSSHRPPHVDWLTTHSGFNRQSFEMLWEKVGAFLLRDGE